MRLSRHVLLPMLHLGASAAVHASESMLLCKCYCTSTAVCMWVTGLLLLCMQCSQDLVIRRPEGAPPTISCSQQQRCTRIALPGATVAANVTQNICEGCNVRKVAFRCAAVCVLTRSAAHAVL